MRCCVQTKQLDSKYLLRFKDVSPLVDNGNYTCVVSNRLGEIRATVQLLVTGISSLSPIVVPIAVILCCKLQCRCLPQKNFVTFSRHSENFCFHNPVHVDELKNNPEVLK